MTDTRPKTKSLYRSTISAPALLRTVRTRQHLDRWAQDLDLRTFDTREHDWVVLDAIVHAEQRAGRLADTGEGAEVVAMSARMLLREMGTTGYTPFGEIRLSE